MSKPVHGDKKIDEEFKAFLEQMRGWSRTKIGNVAAELIKVGQEEVGCFKGRMDAETMTNLEQQIGALKGEMRKKLKCK